MIPNDHPALIVDGVYHDLSHLTAFLVVVPGKGREPGTDLRVLVKFSIKCLPSVHCTASRMTPKIIAVPSAHLIQIATICRCDCQGSSPRDLTMMRCASFRKTLVAMKTW